MTKSDEKVLLDHVGAMESKPIPSPKEETKTEKSKLLTAQTEISPEAERLRIQVLILSWFSGLVLSGLGTATLVVAILEKSTASFSLALDTILGSLTSAVVIWRYTGSGKLVYSDNKEGIACVFLGVLFNLASIVTITRSFLAMEQHLLPSKSPLAWHLSVGIAVSGLAVALPAFIFSKKLHSKKLHSKALIVNAIISTVVFVLGVSVTMSSITYQKNAASWIMDPTIGLLCGVLFMIVGIKLLYDNVKTRKAEDEENKM